MGDKQTDGRRKNGASPAGKPDASTSDQAVKETGKMSTERAGPDGPDAGVVGKTFKR